MSTITKCPLCDYPMWQRVPIDIKRGEFRGFTIEVCVMCSVEIRDARRKARAAR